MRRYRVTVDPSRPESFLPDLACALRDQSNWLAEVGRHEDALTAIDEAIEHYRLLAEAQPKVFLPDLANALNNHEMLADLVHHEPLKTLLVSARNRLGALDRRQREDTVRSAG